VLLDILMKLLTLLRRHFEDVIGKSYGVSHVVQLLVSSRYSMLSLM